VSTTSTWPTADDGTARREFAQRERTLAQYGLTPDDYDRLLTAQGERCAICQAYDPGPDRHTFVVDHDHDTGRVRGLLCGPCNMGLGLLGDHVGSIAAALHYLQHGPL
jgi:hypothetical protein